MLNIQETIALSISSSPLTSKNIQTQYEPPEEYGKEKFGRMESLSQSPFTPGKSTNRSIERYNKEASTAGTETSDKHNATAGKFDDACSLGIALSYEIEGIQSDKYYE